MLGLQELFEKEKDDLFSPNKVLTRLFEKELEGINLLISNTQRTDFEEQFKDLSKGITVDFSKEQIKNAGFKNEEELKPEIERIFSKLPSKIEQLTSNMDKTMRKIVEEVTDQSVEPVIKTLNIRLKEMNEDQDSLSQRMVDSIKSIWGKPLSLMQGIIRIAEESSQWYATRTDEYAEKDLVQKLLFRLTAKAIQISNEIYTLLINGYSDGAQARWRSLHELSVISLFISEHGNDVAERYINHQAIDKYKSAIQHREYYSKLGGRPVTTKTMTALKKEYDELVERYGQNYKYGYGWAAEALSLKKPRFIDIEASIKLDHHRPYYKAASANIHGDPIGVFQSLGTLPFENKAITGPSNLGLLGPAQSLLISLNIITTTMLTHGNSIDSIVICKVLAKYSKSVENEFMKVEREIHESLNLNLI